jgi:thiol-disulfide isomerase/thioredoxin
VRRLARVSVVLAVVLVACGGDQGAERLPDVAVAPLVGGDTIRLSDIEGPAVINLWATWCAPCRAEIPDFESVHQERGDEVRFVGINIGEDGNRAASFIDEVGATYDQFLDSEGFVVTELRTTAMPVTLVLDGNDIVTTRHLGPLDAAGLNEAIDAAIASD